MQMRELMTKCAKHIQIQDPKTARVPKLGARFNTLNMYQLRLLCEALVESVSEIALLTLDRGSTKNCSNEVLCTVRTQEAIN